MNPPDIKDLQQLAMLAELARPLTHECNNFLNNLLLQLAISEKSLTETYRIEWANIRREGKKLANLLQQWQRQRKQPSKGPTKIDINRIIQDTADELRPESATIGLRVRSPGEPFWILGFPGEVQRLACLLLRYAISNMHDAGANGSIVEIEIERNQNRVHLRLADAGPVNTEFRWPDFDELGSWDRATLSLSALTCKSLVERLQGTIRLEKNSNARLALVIDLPLAVS